MYHRFTIETSGGLSNLAAPVQKILGGPCHGSLLENIAQIAIFAFSMTSSGSLNHGTFLQNWQNRRQKPILHTLEAMAQMPLPTPMCST